jgi:NAD(P)-dependent dehydrogenase (short-subunit alcohol dehydrogenase family)
MNEELKNLWDYEAEEGLLDGRVLLITGAAGGIGREVSRSCARHGAQLVLLDHDEEGLKSLYDECNSAGWPEPTLCPVDFAGVGIDHLRQIADAVGNQFGRLDGLLNNAAWVGPLTPFEHYLPQTWGLVMNINMAAPFFLTQWCMPLLRRAPDPVLLFSLHDASRAYHGAFALAKAGQRALLEMLSAEYGPESGHPVRVLGIDPGPIETLGRRQNYPAERLGSHPGPEAVAGAYLWALGPDSVGRNGLILSAHDGRADPKIIP